MELLGKSYHLGKSAMDNTLETPPCWKGNLIWSLHRGWMGLNSLWRKKLEVELSCANMLCLLQCFLWEDLIKEDVLSI